MSTVEEVWGFRLVLAVEVKVDEFCKAMNAAAESRSIAPNVPSDALDMSRDICLDEAAQSLNARWEIVGDTLRLWRSDLTVKWENVTTS